MNVNARCFDGNTALHMACARQLVGMAALLVAAGGDPDCENEEVPESLDGEILHSRGLRPMDYADENDQVIISELVIVSG